ncbi:MAG: hypothetical protein KKB78_04685 [Alphaproteobacteria bacterium]|nr:hypothetical protein [Alphaproteobacteria bacterium]MBU0865526.1 hypothetical protein [Alphaproteobacteria bacterium]
MDVLNLVFGAALGGYVGVVIATEKLSNSDLWELMLLLALISAFLSTIREVAKAVVGLPYLGFKFPFNITMALVTGLAAQILALNIPIAGEKFSIIFRGWMVVIALHLVMTYMRKRKWKQ